MGGNVLARDVGGLVVNQDGDFAWVTVQGPGLTVDGDLSVAGPASFADALYVGPTPNPNEVSIAYNTSVSKGMAVGGSGNFGGALSVMGGIMAYGPTVIASTADSFSDTTGSLVVKGGLGVVKNVTVGNQLYVGGSAIFQASTRMLAALELYDTTPSVSSTTGALVLAGGIGIAGSVNALGNAYFGGTLDVAGRVGITTPAQAYSADSGALVVTGGAGIGKNVYVGGSASIASSLSVGGNAVFQGQSVQFGTLSLQSDTGTLSVLSPNAGLKIGTVTDTVYTNALCLFSLGSTFLDPNFEAVQLMTSGTVLGLDRSVAPTANLDDSSVCTLAVSSGDVVLGRGRLFFGADAAGPPTVGSRSPGTRIVLDTNVSATDKAIGITETQMWFGTGGGDGGFTWYHNATPGVYTDTSDIPATITSTHDSSGTGTGSLVVRGGIGIGKTVTAGTLVVVSTQDSSSPAQGAAVIAGGLGVGKDVLVHGTVVAGSPSLDAVHAFRNGSGEGCVVSIQNADPSGLSAIEFDSGNLRMALGVGNAESGFPGVGFVSVPSGIHFAGNTAVRLESTTESLDRNTGALVVDGGVAVAKKLNVGGSASIVGNCSVAGDADVAGQTRVNLTTDASAQGQGALVVAGGASIAKSLLCGSELSVMGGTYVASLTAKGVAVTSTAQTYETSSGALVVAGGAGIAKNVCVGGNLSVPNGTIVCETASVSDNTDSTGPTSGSLTVTGGVGIARNMNVGGQMHVHGTQSSTSGSTGALVVDGGIGVKSGIFCEGTVTAVGAITSVSDGRLKENVVPVAAADRIRDLQAVEYNFKDNPRREVGLIAQDVQRVFPDLVHDCHGTLSVDYARLTVYLLETLKAVMARLGNRYLKSETYSKADIDRLVAGVQTSVANVDMRVTTLVNNNTLSDLKPNTLWCANGTCVAPGNNVVSSGPHQAKGDGLLHMSGKLNAKGQYRFALEADDEYLRFATFDDNGYWNNMHPLGVHRDGRVDVETNLNLVNKAPINFGSGYTIQVLNWNGEDRLCIVRNGKVVAAFSDGADHLLVPRVSGNGTDYLYFNSSGAINTWPNASVVRLGDEIRIQGNAGANTKYLSLWGNDQQNVNDDFVKVKIVRV
ncbi:hypothetical protein GGF32_002710 [Allomyces javanicus]|nr:hypothetical protein GGF32_002710 [Allomyces javanicus]